MTGYVFKKMTALTFRGRHEQHHLQPRLPLHLLPVRRLRSPMAWAERAAVLLSSQHRIQNHLGLRRQRKQR